jgi:hypothetical protein
MADKKISALTSAATPLDGTEVLPIVQSGSTVKVANNDLRPKQIQSNATSGVLQITGPAAASTRVMTTPNANFTVARTDAAQTFTGRQTVNDIVSGGITHRKGTYTAGDTTPTVAGISYMYISNASPATITNFTNAVDGQILHLIFNDANTTITRNNAYLYLGLNFTSTAYDTLTLIYIAADALWYEISRSVNA